MSLGMEWVPWHRGRLGLGFPMPTSALEWGEYWKKGDRS